MDKEYGNKNNFEQFAFNKGKGGLFGVVIQFTPNFDHPTTIIAMKEWQRSPLSYKKKRKK